MIAPATSSTATHSSKHSTIAANKAVFEEIFKKVFVAVFMVDIGVTDVTKVVAETPIVGKG